jgi:hypothetical protein
MMSTRHFMQASVTLASLALALAGCCFSGGGGTTAPPPPGVGAPAVGGGATVNLAPGFMPDPTILSGTAVGTVSASTMSPSCAGYVPAAPNHILNVTAPFLTPVTLSGTAAVDTVMVIRLADGRVICNDDGPVFPNPQLVEMLPMGQHQVFYGTYSPGGNTPYTLSISAVAAPPAGLGGLAGLLGGGGYPGAPTHCGMAVPDYGPIRIGTSVVIGSHTGWTGPDGHGGFVTDDTWWNDSMWAYVGQRTVVTELGGLDPAGCPYVRTAVDSGSWGWRIRNLSP